MKTGPCGKIPVNLLVFLAVAGVFYLVILPKKTRFVANLMESIGVKTVSREDTVRAMVAARILADVCPKADLSAYKALGWSEYFVTDENTTSIIHAFSCDGANRKFLFRLRSGSISEIIDLL